MEPILFGKNKNNMPKLAGKRRLSAKQRTWLSNFIFFGVAIFAFEAFFQFPSETLLKAAGSQLNPKTVSEVVQSVCLGLPLIFLLIVRRWQP